MSRKTFWGISAKNEKAVFFLYYKPKNANHEKKKKKTPEAQPSGRATEVILKMFQIRRDVSSTDVIEHDTRLSNLCDTKKGVMSRAYTTMDVLRYLSIPIYEYSGMINITKFGTRGPQRVSPTHTDQTQRSAGNYYKGYEDVKPIHLSKLPRSNLHQLTPASQTPTPALGAWGTCVATKKKKRARSTYQVSLINSLQS